MKRADARLLVIRVASESRTTGGIRGQTLWSISARTNLSIETVRCYLSALIESGHVERIPNPLRRTSHLYRLFETGQPGSA